MNPKIEHWQCSGHQIRPVKLTSIYSTCLISSPNPMFEHLLESSGWDDSNKWSNKGFGKEIGIIYVKNDPYLEHWQCWRYSILLCIFQILNFLFLKQFIYFNHLGIVSVEIKGNIAENLKCSIYTSLSVSLYCYPTAKHISDVIC